MLFRSTGIKVLTINDHSLTGSSSTSYRTVDGTSSVRVHVESGDPLVKVKIGDFAPVFAQDTQDIRVQLKITNPAVIPINLYSYPYGDSDSTITTLVNVYRYEGDYGVTRVAVKDTTNNSSANYEPVEADIWGEYTVQIPAATTSINLQIISKDAEQDLAIIKRGETNKLSPNVVDVMGTDGDNNPIVVRRNYEWTLTNINGLTNDVNEFTLVVSNNSGSAIYPLTIRKMNNNNQVGSITVNQGMSSETVVNTITPNMDYRAELDKSETSAHIRVTADDPKASIRMVGGSTTYIGQMNVEVPLVTGNSMVNTTTVDIEITATDGVSKRIVTLNLDQMHNTAEIDQVILDGTALTPSGTDYTGVLAFINSVDLILQLADNATAQITDENGNTVSGTSTPGSWNGTLSLQQEKDNRFHIQVTSQSGMDSKDYLLVVRHTNLDVGIVSDSIPAQMKLSSGATTTTMNAPIPLKPDSNFSSGKVFTAKIPEDEKFVEFWFDAISENNALGQNWPVITSSGGTNITKLGDGHYMMDLEHLSKVNDRKPSSGDVDSAYKDVYVQLYVKTPYTDGSNTSTAYVEEYTLHIIRSNSDNTLRLIEMVPSLSSAADIAANTQLYDNVKPTTTPVDPWKGYLDAAKRPNGSTDPVMTSVTENGSTVYQMYVDSSINKTAITIQATYESSQVSVGVDTAPAITPSSTYVQTIPVVLTQEKTRLQIIVRAADNLANNDVVYYLDIYRTDSDATLKEVFTTHDVSGNPFKTMAIQDTNDTSRYDVYISTDQTSLTNVDLTAIANKLAAQVTLTSGTGTGVITSAAAMGQNTIKLPKIDNDANNPYNIVNVRVTASNQVNYTDYTVHIHLVNLELDIVEVSNVNLKVDPPAYDAKENITGGFYVENIGGTDSKVYYAIVNTNRNAIDLKLSVMDQVNAYMGVSAANGPAVAPVSTLKTSYQPGIDISVLPPANDPIQFQVTVESSLASGVTKDHYVRVYRSNSDVNATVIVHYLDEDRVEQRVVATLNGKEYSAAVPSFVKILDIEVIGPNDLSYVKLNSEGKVDDLMKDFVRKQHTVKNYGMVGEQARFDLDVKAMDGTLGQFKVVIYRDNTGIEVKVDNVEIQATTALRNGKTVTVYNAMASSTDKANVYISAKNNRNTIQVNRTDRKSVV